MSVHGVDENEYMKLANMKYLYQEIQKADKILNF